MENEQNTSPTHFVARQTIRNRPGTFEMFQ
jgi:hypothetical protein